MKKVKHHLLFWSLYVFYHVIMEYVTPGVVIDTLDTILIHVIHVANFYFIVFCLSRSESLKTITRVLIMSISFLMYVLILWVYCSRFISFIGHGLYYQNLPFRGFFRYASDLYFQFMFFAVGYYYLAKLRKNELELNLERNEKLSLQNKYLVLEKQNLELQSAKTKSDYNFLKAQINPHFLYNTLNFFYSRTEEKDPETAEGIILLTNIMRYSLQQGEDGKVHISDEIKHLENYIRLQQLRFENKLFIDIENTIEEGRNYRILPHIFITLVENAFKHGDIRDKRNPLRIRLYTKQERLYFEVSNKIRKGGSDTPGTGVGLINVLERLRMEYGDAVEMVYGEAGDFFKVSLAVPLSLIEKQEQDRTPDYSSAQPQALIA